MSMIEGYFVRLFELLNYHDLWLPLLVVISSTAYASFLATRFFYKRSPHDVVLGAMGAQLKSVQVENTDLHKKVEEAKAREANNDKLQEAILNDESELWRLHDPRPPAEYSAPINKSRAKIIVIANNKGGVGKTTLTAGLAAYFEKKQNKRVLLIDLDYQGSLTNWMIKSAEINIPLNQPHRLSRANKLIDGSAKNQSWQAEVLSNGRNGHSLANAQLITSDYTLTECETKLMLRWLQNGGKQDIRYNLAEVLLGPHVQSGFDVVLIDAPPRLTTGTVGALVASTHLLVPTILDRVSAEAVGSFLRQAWALRKRLNQGIELAGVVGTMTPARPLGKELGDTEQDALGVVKRGITEWQASTHIFGADVQEIAAIKNHAGRENSYFSSDKASDMFDLLGDELCERISL